MLFTVMFLVRAGWIEGQASWAAAWGAKHQFLLTENQFR
jgi:hypothetical protein